MLRAAAGLRQGLRHQPTAADGSTAGITVAAPLSSSRGMAAGEVRGVPTGPPGGYSDPWEAGILEESEGQHREDQRNAERLTHQASCVRAAFRAWQRGTTPLVFCCVLVGLLA
jgi:hypothetical protein